jgi:hypothetical protein
MSLALTQFERFFDRIVPGFFLALGFTVVAGAAVLGN